MTDNSKGSNYLLKKYWKAWVFLASIILTLYLVNEFFIQYEYYMFIAVAQLIILPVIFIFYATQKEKGEDKKIF